MAKQGAQKLMAFPFLRSNIVNVYSSLSVIIADSSIATRDEVLRTGFSVHQGLIQHIH
jgi:hypothetical protein